MIPRTRQLYLRSLSGVLLGAGVLVLTWTLLVPPTLEDAEAVASRSVVQKQSTPVSPASFKMDFETIVARQLQRPLFDPPPPVAAPVPTKPKPQLPTIKLLATMIEPSGNQAMLADSKGTIQILRVGGSIGEGQSAVILKEINPQQVIVQYDGETFTLQLSVNP
jgi:hypothetical protein